ncbi:sulfurtransferase-related protein [Skeletonema marinoi]|uniref:Sulfurtransferase-related protein n=1 Tax=Skeletonema marinoi TaxID=267567 RepID=A0AAD8YIU3_9STRA|nr:sulfurtransferase-related protein [Skeletonema marinoi]
MSNEMESGSSLAEDAWAVPSITSAAAVASNDQTTNPSSTHNNNNKSSTVDEAWAKIAALRSKLAAMACPSHSFTAIKLHHNVPSPQSRTTPIHINACHANTHTNITYTGSQSTAFVSEARQIVGSVLGIVNDSSATNGNSGGDTRPVVFAGPHEHHSNLLPWRESGWRLRMGAFSAVSNVTGLIADVDAIAIILHRHGALAFFDYASGAPYVKMNMNPNPIQFASHAKEEGEVVDASKDAIYFSPHNIGGEKRLISQTNPPAVSGGGTVFYVTNQDHRFLSNRIERYEGGTPDGIGIQRCGLALLAGRRIAKEYEQIAHSINKEQVPPKTLLEYECSTYDRVVAELKQHAPNLVMLGSEYDSVHESSSPRGCQCAGPYSQRLLGLTKIVNGNEVSNEANRSIERALLRSDHPCELLRPGYTRLSLPFKGVRKRKWTMLFAHWLGFPRMVGLCFHSIVVIIAQVNGGMESMRQTIGQDTNHLGKSENNSTQSDEAKASQDRLDQAMKNADAILELSKRDPRFIAEVEKMNTADGMLGDSGDGGVDDTLEDLRWYVYQREAAPSLRDGLDEVPETFDDDKLMGGLCVRMDEGDHAGEASFDEIKAGFEEGELSEACEVFHKGRDEWLVIEDFIKDCEDGDSDSSTASRKRDISTMFGSTNPRVQSAASGTPSQVVNKPEAATKREKKKPSRDSSQWGQCSVPHITPSDAASAVAPSVFPSDNVDSNTDTPALKPVTKESNKSKKNKGKIKPPPKMMRSITQAMIQWDMIQDGDRLLLGLSGGKDSLSLLHCLLEFQRKLPIKFDIECCTIDPMTPSFDPSPLIPYVEGLGLKYHYIRDDIVERANTAGKDGKTVSSLCAFCARMKRGNLYTTARKNNCNKLVLAQHLDDCAESFLMSIMHNGFIRTMKANYQINAGDVSVIRPLVYCRENLMTEFAKANNLPVINENCPACFEEPKERARVKKLLAREETFSNRKEPEGTAEAKEEAPQRQDAMVVDNSSAPPSSNNNQTEGTPSISLASASEEELIAELARRRAEKYKMAGAMKRLPDDNAAEGTIEDSTGQMCSLNGGDGMIPCRELME